MSPKVVLLWMKESGERLSNFPQSRFIVDERAARKAFYCMSHQSRFPMFGHTAQRINILGYLQELPTN